jgi:hypothetical protein
VAQRCEVVGRDVTLDLRRGGERDSTKVVQPRPARRFREVPAAGLRLRHSPARGLTATSHSVWAGALTTLSLSAAKLPTAGHKAMKKVTELRFGDLPHLFAVR